MKRESFEIKANYGPSTMTGYRLSDYWAVDHRDGAWWSITHLPTGFAFLHYVVTREEAVSIVRSLDWLGDFWDCDDQSVLKQRVKKAGLKDWLNAHRAYIENSATRQNASGP